MWFYFIITLLFFEFNLFTVFCHQKYDQVFDLIIMDFVVLMEEGLLRCFVLGRYYKRMCSTLDLIQKFLF